MGRLSRTVIAISAVLLLVSPAMADHADWRGHPTSRWEALNEALVPVHLGLRENMEANAAINQRYGSFDTLTEDAATVREVWLRFQDLAREGLAILDAHPPEPCFADYWAVERVGFLKLGDATAEFPSGGGSFSLFQDLMMSPGLAPSYADLTASLIECD